MERIVGAGAKPALSMLPRGVMWPCRGDVCFRLAGAVFRGILRNDPEGNCQESVGVCGVCSAPKASGRRTVTGAPMIEDAE